MEVIYVILPLLLLMYAAYRGFSVILFAPLTAMLAVLLINPAWVPAFFSGIFMEGVKFHQVIFSGVPPGATSERLLSYRVLQNLLRILSLKSQVRA